MLFEIFLGGCMVFVLRLLYENLTARKLPPGPIKFPLIGNLVQILHANIKPHLAFTKLAQKYGDVMQLKMGVCDLVVISSSEAAHAICSQDSVTGRHQSPFMLSRTFGKNIGFFFSGGELWKNTKRFVVRNLRNHGFGKSQSMEKVILEQADELVERLVEEMKSHGRIDMSDCFGIPVLNVLWSMVAGETFPQNDVRLRRLLQIQDDTVKSGDFGGGIEMCFPVLTKWLPRICGYTDFAEKNKILQNFIREILNSRRKYLENHKPTCFTDTFLIEIDKSKTSGKEEFCEEHGIVTVMDLFTAGGETSSTGLTFCVLYTLLFPEVQSKVHQEIDRFMLTENSAPGMDDIEKFPYTRAVILEVMRHGIVVPFTPPRTSSVDIEYNGMRIRKNTPILVNIAAIVSREDVWGDTKNFRPERFLSDSGELDLQQCEKLQNFGFGHRRCPGQRLGESIMFLFYIRLLQRFQLAYSDVNQPPTLEPNVGFTISPKPFTLALIIRQSNFP